MNVYYYQFLWISDIIYVSFNQFIHKWQVIFVNIVFFLYLVWNTCWMLWIWPIFYCNFYLSSIFSIYISIYLAHVVCYIFEDHSISICLHCYLSEYIYESYGEVKVLDMMMRQYVKKKPYKLKKVEALFKIFTK